MKTLIFCCGLFLSSCFVKQRLKETIEDRVFYMYYYYPDSTTQYLNDSIEQFYKE